MNRLDTSSIVCAVSINPVGKRESINYEWKGKSPYVYVSHDLLSEFMGIGEKMDVIQIGPYKLVKLEREPSLDAWLCVRSDKLGAFRVWLYKATRLLDLIYRRLIITLAVWRLAEYRNYSVPTWRDINILKRFSK